MTVEASPGEFIKETITFLDGSDAQVNYFLVTFTQQKTPHAYAHAPTASLAYSQSRRRASSASRVYTLEPDEYLGPEMINGRVVIADTENTIEGIFGGEERVVSKSHYEIAPEEELIGLIFRTLSGEYIEM